MKKGAITPIERFKVHLEIGAIQEAERLMSNFDRYEMGFQSLAFSLLVKKYRELGQEQKIKDLLTKWKSEFLSITDSSDRTLKKLHLFYYHPLGEIELCGFSPDEVKKELREMEKESRIQKDMLIKCWVKVDPLYASKLLERESSSISLAKIFSLSKEAD